MLGGDRAYCSAGGGAAASGGGGGQHAPSPGASQHATRMTPSSAWVPVRSLTEILLPDAVLVPPQSRKLNTSVFFWKIRISPNYN